MFVLTGEVSSVWIPKTNIGTKFRSAHAQRTEEKQTRGLLVKVRKASPLPKKKRRAVYAVITLGIVLLIIAPALFIFCSRLMGQRRELHSFPGSANSTAQAIIVDGTETYPPEGEIAYTTVSIKREVTLWEWIRAKQDKTKQLISPSVIDGNRTVSETRKVTQFQMDQSQSTAVLVALNFLGYEIVPEVDGAFVIRLVEGSPAQKSLQLGILSLMSTEKKFKILKTWETSSNKKNLETLSK